MATRCRRCWNQTADSASPSSPSLAGTELKERVAPRLGDARLECIVDADPVAPEEGNGWPPAGSQQRTKQARLPVLLERAPQVGCCLVGWEFDGLNRDAATVLGQGRLTGRHVARIFTPRSCFQIMSKAVDSGCMRRTLDP